MCSRRELLLATQENSFDVGNFVVKGSLDHYVFVTNKQCVIVLNASD